MKSFFRIVLLLLLLQAPHMANGNSEIAFNTFKGFRGKWVIQSTGKTLPIEMTSTVGSNGSIVTEQFGKELSVIYRNGQESSHDPLLQRRQPATLAPKGKRGGPGLFEFDMFDITNLKNEDAAHVEKITYTVTDDKKIALEIVWKEGTSETSEKKYTLTKF